MKRRASGATGAARGPVEHAQDGALESLASAVHYNDWLAALAEPWLGDSVIEIGAGTGSVGVRWVRPGRQVTLSEPEARRVRLLRERYGGLSGVMVEQLGLPAPMRADYSSAVAVNVVEHIADDRAAVASMARLVRPGGHVVLLVPAFQSAMSEFDRSVGHHRRYRRDQVSGLLLANGLQPVEVRYVNAVGLLGWYLVVRGLGRSPSDGRLLRLFDRRVVPVARRLEQRRRPPFGQSVFAVGRVGG